jgi:hypothetical protein
VFKFEQVSSEGSNRTLPSPRIFFEMRKNISGNDQLDALFLNVFILCLYMFRAASAHHQEDQIVNTSSGILMQFGPPDDEHLLLETCRGIKINTLRKSASSWSLPRIASRCTVNKT